MMSATPGNVSTAIPSNKFYPPHIDVSQSLPRTRLLDSILLPQSTTRKAIIVEAQAGQGKTTLISQYLEHNDLEYLWYQVGPEDTDPVQLLASLAAALTLRHPPFKTAQLSEILRNGEVGPLDLRHLASLFLREIDAYLTYDLHIVFDDLHLISGAKLTTSLLEYILDTSPPKLRFILSSRHPLELKCKTLRDANKICYLSTEDLALTRTEIEELFNSVFSTSITSQEAIDIHRVTKGWVMGIVLASHPVSGRPRFWQQPAFGLGLQPQAEDAHLLDYFQEEIFAKIPTNLHTPFIRLSYLNEIPAELAIELTDIQEFGEILSAMTRENFFIYRLDDSRSVFRFHHFFQEFLQNYGRKCLSSEEIKEIHTAEARYYLEREHLDKALASYRSAGDFQVMQRLLRDKGMELIAKNRTLTILSLLESIPQDTLFQFSWLTLFAGLMRNDFIPRTTLPYYERARELFIEEGDEMGELVALTQMIYFHFVIAGQYNTGSQLLPRTAQLLKENAATLPDHVKIMAARNLASGHCFFNGEMDRARTFIIQASNLATRHNSRNFIASARFIQGYIELLSGNHTKYLREAENCYSLLHDPLVGMSNKLTIRIMYLCFLSMTGDFLNFKLQQQAIQESIDQTVVDQTIAAPYMFVWGASCYFALGQTSEAMNLLHRGIGVSATARTSHMQSQLQQWLAYGHGLQGEKEQARELLGQAALLRREAGGPFYEAFHHTIAGATWIRLGDWQQAHRELTRGLELAEAISSNYLQICTLWQLAYLQLCSSEQDGTLDYLDTALSLMKANGYTYFWGWEPVMMNRLLGLAVRFDIEKGFAQMLGRERLQTSFTDEGEPIPLLFFSLLDTFQISRQQEVLCRSKDLTPSQRELLGLLLTAKGQRISQERVQLEMWPDNTPENARKSYDTLLTRLRKELTRSGLTAVKQHISMQKGILCLANYQMDTLLFLAAARKGLVHSRNSEWWQAGNAFQQAFALWTGALPEDTFKSEQVLAYSDQLTSTLIEIAAIWSEHLAQQGRTDEAIQALDKVLASSGLEERLITLLYALHQKNNAPIKARETLERYRAALHRVDYTELEVEEYLQEVISSAQELNRQWAAYL